MSHVLLLLIPSCDMQEHVAVQQQLEALTKDNTVLKRAVAIQHERQKALEDANQQLELLKHLIPQYQEKLRTLEVSLFNQPNQIVP